MSDESLNAAPSRPATGAPSPGADPPDPGGPPAVPNLAGRVREPRPRDRRALRKPTENETQFTPEQRLLVLDAWRRSGLPAGDFAPLVGLSRHTLYAWKKKFEDHGPAGLVDKPRGAPAGSKLPEVTRRTILMLKEAHPDWGCQRISDLEAWAGTTFH